MKRALLLVLLLVPIAASLTPDAAWSSGPLEGAGAEGGAGLPSQDARGFRILLLLPADPDLAGIVDQPARAVVDVAQALAAATPRPYPTYENGQLKGFRLNMASFQLYEIDPATYAPLDNKALPIQVAPGAPGDPTPFDPATHPVVTIDWIAKGVAGPDRAYMLYFDAKDVAASDPGATGIGPAVGRGNRHFVLLHGDLGVAGAGDDPRAVRITNMGDQAAAAAIHFYDRFGQVDPQPAAMLTVPAGRGSVVMYSLPLTYKGEALMVQTTGGVVSVEAGTRGNAANFPVGTGRHFLPADGGGLMGKRFTGTSAAAEQLLVYCPKDPGNEEGCTIRVNGQTSSIAVHGFHAARGAAGSAFDVVFSKGSGLVQRVPDVTSAAANALSPWPNVPRDTGNGFYGHARADAPVDQLVVAAAAASTRISASSLSGARPTLTDGVDLGAGTLWAEPASFPWATAWNRPWSIASEPSATPQHLTGPALLRASGAGTPFIASGQASRLDAFSFSMAIPGQAGGTAFDVVLPGDRTGAAIGRLVAFATESGTNIKVSGTPSGGSMQCCTEHRGLAGGSIVDPIIDRTGAWRIESDRPIIVYWQRIASEGFSVIAAGTTVSEPATVAGAQYAGHIFDIEPVQRVQTARPGAWVEFEVRVRNLAQDVSGAGLPQVVRLTASGPAGWNAAEVVPATLALAAGAEGTARIGIQVPANAGSQGTASLRIVGRSDQNALLSIEENVRVNMLVHRGLQMTANGHVGGAEIAVGPGESASYSIRILNTGGISDRYFLEFEDARPQATMHITCPGTGSCFEGLDGWSRPLAPGESQEILLDVAPNPGVETRVVTRILGTSEGNPSIRGSLRLVTAPETDRAFAWQSEATTQVAPPGQTARFEARLLNLAESDEELFVSVAFQAFDGWPDPVVHVRLPGAGEDASLASLGGSISLPPGAEAKFTVLQALPMDAQPLQVASLRMRAESRFDAGLPPALAELRVVPATVLGFEVEALPQIAGVAGHNVTIPIQIVSTANVPQPLSIAFGASSDGWRSSLAGMPLPGNHTLAPGETWSPTWVVALPSHAAPLADGGAWTEIAITTPGLDPVRHLVEVHVAPRPRLHASTGPTSIQPNHAMALEVHVENQGNTAIEGEFSMAGMVSLERTPFLVTAGQAHTFRVPALPGFSLQNGTQTLSLSMTTGEVLEVPVDFVVKQPRLRTELLGREALPEWSIASVRVSNDGDAAAYGVWIVAMQGGQVVDRAPLDLLRPGESRQVTLVLPSRDAPQIVVEAEHLAEPLLVHDAAVVLHRDAPGPGLITVLVLVSLALARRRSL